MIEGSKIACYLRTVRPLKPIQIYWRLRTRALSRLGRRYRMPPAPRHIWPAGAARRRVEAYLSLLREHCPADAEALLPFREGRFSLGGAPVAASSPPWEGAGRERLWQYRLHYCSFARAAALAGIAAYRRRAKAWLLDWVLQHPPGSSVAWEPYPVARRLLHWPLLLCAGEREAGDGRLWASYRAQAAWLARNQEYDLQANHLLTGLCAQAVSESLLEGQATPSTLAAIAAEIEEQFLADGGHYERSPHYHAVLLGDLLDLRALAPESATILEEPLPHLAGFLLGVCHSDGEVGLFQDSMLEEHSPPTGLAALTKALIGRPVTTQPANRFSGFFCMGKAEGLSSLAFVGPPGPAYQPGHAHGGCLGFECSWQGRRIVVHPGVHGYGGSPYRAYNRSTRAHNTVVVNGREQLECWGDFRVGRRYRSWLQAWRNSDAGRYLCARHDGFRPYTHMRHFLSLTEGGLVIRDEIVGPGDMEVESFLHLHPEIEAQVTEHGWLLGDTGLLLVLFGVSSAQWVRGTQDPIQGWYSPRVGEALPAPTLQLRTTGRVRLVTGYGIFPPTLSESGGHAAWAALESLAREGAAKPGSLLQ